MGETPDKATEPADHDADGLPLPTQEAAEKWLRAVWANPPNALDLAELYMMLDHAADLDRRGLANPNLPPGMTGPSKAVRAFAKFLAKQPPIMRAGAAAPILRLLAGIGDLADDTVGEMFRPPHRPPGRRPMGQARAAVVGLAARTQSELMLAGLTEEAAAQRIGSVLGERPETISNWRLAILRDRPQLSAAAAHYHEPLPDLGDTATERAVTLLARLAARARSLR